MQNELVLLLGGRAPQRLRRRRRRPVPAAGDAGRHADGEVPIEQLMGRRRGPRRRRRRRDLMPGHVTHVEGGPLRRAARTGSRAGGRHARGHAAPHRAGADSTLEPVDQLVYLMHRADRGYRVGVTMSVRPTAAGPPDSGSACGSTRSTATSCGARGLPTRAARRRTGRRGSPPTYGLPTALLPRRRSRPGDGRRLARPALREHRHRRPGQGAHGRICDLHPDFPHHRPRTAAGARR